MAMHPSADLGPRMNHVFVDFENVHHIDPNVFASKVVNVVLLLGATQMKLDVEMMETLMSQAASVQLIRLSSPGKNALDFTLSYYLGRAVVADPTGYFHVVSRDKGFDPLMEHLRSRHVEARRHDDFSTLTFSAPKKPAAKPASSTKTAGLPKPGGHQRATPKNGQKPAKREPSA